MDAGVTPTKQGLGFRHEKRRGVQHHWHTARNEAIAKGGKESGTLDSVPAKQVRPLS